MTMLFGGIPHFSTVHNVHLFFNILRQMFALCRHQMQRTKHSKHFSFTISIIGLHSHKMSLHLSFHFVTWLAKIFQNTTAFSTSSSSVQQEYISIDDKQHSNTQFPELNFIIEVTPSWQLWPERPKLQIQFPKYRNLYFLLVSILCFPLKAVSHPTSATYHHYFSQYHYCCPFFCKLTSHIKQR